MTLCRVRGTCSLRPIETSLTIGKIITSDSPQGGNGTRQVALHVNFNDPERLNYVLNNAENIYQYYHQKGMKIEIRIIAHGPGLHMFRDDTSPVKERVSNLAASQDGLSF